MIRFFGRAGPIVGLTPFAGYIEFTAAISPVFANTPQQLLLVTCYTPSLLNPLLILARRNTLETYDQFSALLTSMKPKASRRIAFRYGYLGGVELRNNLVSFVSERHNGIHAGCPIRRRQRGQQRDYQKQ